ncbi:MAG: UDP-N-acetylmuramoyl-tripeptide--D-alanyl-D-alanine ligase [Ignavibacteria bacterium]|nr:UDP-N-acetylmuramoyl-tripeptide--D-alanyl-D-alanine ligase [Ignavibacteria bacterium]
MSTFDHHDLLAIAGDAADAIPDTVVVKGVSTDTRTLAPENAFLALRGENFDGHEYVDQAFDKGASIAVIDVVRFPDYAQRWRGRPIVAVADPLHTLGSFAWYHRRRFDIPVIAIAGAAGKTSTKDITAHVLSEAMRVLQTERNFNNRIGTPHTLLKLTGEHEAAVIEIGTNEPGEIELLSAMVQPTHGLITNIGKEHLEKLIDLDGVEHEETALFDYLTDNGGLLFVNVDDERLQRYGYHGHHGRSITFGIENEADIRLQVTFDEELHPTIHLVKGTTTLHAHMHTVGLASAYNATCAVAVAWSLNYNAHQIKQGLESYQPPTPHGYARMTVERIGGLAVLNDTYNANPESMKMSLKTLAMYPAQRRLAVLGDMRELGYAALDEHLSVLEHALQSADLVIIIGETFRLALQNRRASHAIEADSFESAARMIRESTHDGSVVLIKGSRGMQMENVILHLRSSAQ